MVDVVDTIVEDTQQPRSCPAVEECRVEEKHLGGVGSTTTNHIAETADGRKRASGSSRGKVRVHSNLNIWFALKVVRFGPK